MKDACKDCDSESPKRRTRKRIIFESDSEESGEPNCSSYKVNSEKSESDSEIDDVLNRRRHSRRLKINTELDEKSDSTIASSESDKTNPESDFVVADRLDTDSDVDTYSLNPTRRSSRLKRQIPDTESDFEEKETSARRYAGMKRVKICSGDQKIEDDISDVDGNNLKSRNSTRVKTNIDNDENFFTEKLEPNVRRSNRLKRKNSVDYTELDLGPELPADENVRRDDRGKSISASRSSTKARGRLRRISFKDSSSSSGDEQGDVVTPVRAKPQSPETPPRTESVRRSGRKRHKSFTLPDRKSILDGVDTSPVKRSDINYYRREKSTAKNNLVKW